VTYSLTCGRVGCVSLQPCAAHPPAPRQRDLAHEASRSKAGASGWRRSELRTRVIARDKRCMNCGSTEHLQADHIIPVAHGGQTTLANMQALCAQCNARKGAR